MPAPFKAANVHETFGPNMDKRYYVILNNDAADILGETKLRHVFVNIKNAEAFSKHLQSKLDALHDDACE